MNTCIHIGIDNIIDRGMHLGIGFDSRTTDEIVTDADINTLINIAIYIDLGIVFL